MTPREIVSNWVLAFNTGNANQIAEFYADRAINHQVANEPVVGKQAIRDMFTEEFAQAEMTCLVENIFEDGEWAILEWKDAQSLRGCGIFHFQEGKIVFQRGYWDKLSFLRQNGMPLPIE